MSTSPLVSAIMVSRNNAAVIREAIESVLAQTYEHLQLMIIENASNDNSWEIIRRAADRDHRISPLRLESEVSIPRARNLGLDFATGEYIATIDADDSWLPERLGLQIEFMCRDENARLGVCGANCLLVDEQGETLGRKQFPETHEQCVSAIWYRNPFCHSATLIRRSVQTSCAGYDETFVVAEDLDLWFRAGRVYQLHNLQEYLVKYRVWRNNVTFQKHQQTVRSTIRARLLARKHRVYAISACARAALCFTWLAQWLPPRAAHVLFHLSLRCLGQRCQGRWPSVHSKENLLRRQGKVPCMQERPNENRNCCSRIQ